MTVMLSAMAVEVFVDGVVDDFPDEMVQPLAVDAADVHRRPFADRFETFEDGDVLGGVTAEGTQSLLSLRAKKLQCRLDLLLEVGEVVFHDGPNDGRVDLEIVMDENVSHSLYRAPRPIRVRLLKGW